MTNFQKTKCAEIKSAHIQLYSNIINNLSEYMGISLATNSLPTYLYLYVKQRGMLPVVHQHYPRTSSVFYLLSVSSIVFSYD